MIKTYRYFKLYLSNWQLLCVAMDLVTLAFEVKLQSLFWFFCLCLGFCWCFNSEWSFILYFNKFIVLSFWECLLRSKEKKWNALINARHCRAFYNCCTITCIYIYQLLVHLVYSGNSTKIYGFFFFLNHVQTHVMIFYTYIYILFLHCIGICAQDYL